MRRKILLCLAIFVPVYAVYLATMPRTVYWQDSGIFLSGIKALGVVYPPGFPLYILLGWGWTKVLASLVGEWMTFAAMVHAFSGVWGALAASLAGLTAYELIGAQQSQRKGAGVHLLGEFLAGLVAGWAVGFSYSLWSQSINAEVYSLAGFFAALLLWLVVRLVLEFLRDPVEVALVRRWIVAIALGWGLSFANHPITVVFLPALFWLLGRLGLFPWQLMAAFFPKEEPMRVGWGVWRKAVVVFVAAGFLPYSLLPIRSWVQTEYLWERIDSLPAFLTHVTGRGYLTQEGAIDWLNFEKILSFPVLFFQEYLVVGVGLGVLGWWWLRRHGPQMRILLEFGWVLTAGLYLLVNFYEQGTEYNLWLIPFYVWFGVLVGCGLASVARRPLIFGLLGLGLVGPQLVVNWRLLERWDFVLAREFGENLLGKLPEGAVLFTIGDQESAIPQYLQLVEEYRTDVILVWDSTLTRAWTRERLAKRHPDLMVPEAETGKEIATVENFEKEVDDFLRENIGKREIFLVTRSVVSLSADFILVPYGTLWKVVAASALSDAALELSAWEYRFSDPMRYRRPERFEHSRKVKGVYGEVVGRARVKYSDTARSFELQSKKNLADWCVAAEKEQKRVRVKTNEGELETWTGEALLECARKGYEEMFLIDPKFYHRNVYLSLAEVYRKLGREEEGRRYYNEVVRRSMGERD